MTSLAAILSFRMRQSHCRNFCPILFKFWNDVVIGLIFCGIIHGTRKVKRGNRWLPGGGVRRGRAPLFCKKEHIFQSIGRKDLKFCGMIHCNRKFKRGKRWLLGGGVRAPLFLQNWYISSKYWAQRLEILWDDAKHREVQEGEEVIAGRGVRGGRAPLFKKKKAFIKCINNSASYKSYFV